MLFELVGRRRAKKRVERGGPIETYEGAARRRARLLQASRPPCAAKPPGAPEGSMREDEKLQVQGPSERPSIGVPAVARPRESLGGAILASDGGQSRARPGSLMAIGRRRAAALLGLQVPIKRTLVARPARERARRRTDARPAGHPGHRAPRTLHRRLSALSRPSSLLFLFQASSSAQASSQLAVSPTHPPTLTLLVERQCPRTTCTTLSRPL